MHWRLKGAIQKVLGSVPFGDELHYQMQRRAGGLRNPSREIGVKIDDALLLIKDVRSVSMPIDGTRFLEIGTGWYPTFPLCLHVGGAKQVRTLDLNRYMRPELTRQCMVAIEGRAAEIAAAGGLDPTAATARASATRRALERGESLESATDGVIRYDAPADASKTALPEGSVDVVYSNDVLEHIPGPVIERIFAEAMRILRPGGIMFHAVNCGDHYAYSDGSISQLNYLRYSDEDWSKYNNRFLYQNRLRAVDFIEMAKAAGFAIEHDSSRPHPKRLAELAQVPVHPQFARYDTAQLAITSISFVGRKAEVVA